MSSEPKHPRSLREIEMAVEAEGREWMRQRLQQELQKEADLHGGVFPPQQPTRPRVEWHEWKTGVYYRQEQSGRTAGGRGVLAQKWVVGWQGEPVEFGRRLHWEAMSAGLGRARSKLIVADGAAWI